MISLRRMCPFFGTLGLCLLVAIGAPSRSLAEVGIGGPASFQMALSPYILGVIGDDPDPFSSVWRAFNAGALDRRILNPGGEANGDGYPTVLADPNTGLVLVAWAQNSPNGFDVVVSRFLNSAWTVPQVVAGSPAVSEKDPNLVLGPDGSVHLFYWVDGPTPQVYYTTAPADVSTWSTPVLVSQPGQASLRPAGAFYAGILRVAYEVHDFGYGNAPRQIVLARQDGTGFTPEVVAMTSNVGDVRSQVHSHDGKIWIDWVDAETNGSGEIAWTRLDAQGHWEPLQYEAFANREQKDYLARGAVRMKAIQ